MALLAQLLSWWRQAELPVWYDPSYRLPLTSLQSRVGFDPRRADLALWFSEDQKVIRPELVHRPERISYTDLARVHTAAYLEALSQPETLAAIFSLDAWDIQSDALMTAIRLACGGTLAAAREALRRNGPTLNLFGGFHHAAPDRGAGMCALNDVAVAIAALRSEGWKGRFAVLDLDAHPPDGTAACAPLLGEGWIGSLSGSDWGKLEGVDETVCADADDARYLELLEGLLTRMPAADLIFVIAGGDVLAGDPLGRLKLSAEGAWQRDRRVLQKVDGRPSVWLPAGGYREDAWRVLAGTAWILRRNSQPRIPTTVDPLALRFAQLSAAMPGEKLGSWELDLDDVAEALGIRSARPTRFLGFYTAAGVEYALHRFGILAQLERLGYRDFQVEFLPGEPGERMRLTGSFPGATGRELLVESCLEAQMQPDQRRILFVHWLSLRHPRGAFGRPPLPGQEVPGLGMAREAGELLGRMCERLELAAVGLRPAWFHVAYTARYRYRFSDARLQGRFQAMIRDLVPCFPRQGGFALAEASQAIATGRIWVEEDGKRTVLSWEPGLMLDRGGAEGEEVENVCNAVRFGVLNDTA